MSPIVLTGAGWLLAALGFFVGGIGGLVALIGFGVMVYGLHSVRWRNDWFGRAFWLTAIALLLLLTIMFLLYGRAQVYTLTLAQAAIAVCLARGVRECVAPSTEPTGSLRALHLTSLVVAASMTVAVVVDAIALAGAEVSATLVAVLLLVTGLAGIVFGGLLVSLGRAPALQADV